MTTGGSDRHTEILAELERAYSEWGGGILRFATRLCGNREDAEDVVVETFTHAYQQWDGFRGNGSRRSWLYGIAVNRCRMSKRRRRFEIEPLRDDLPSSSPGTIDRIALQQAIAVLPRSQRESFLLVKSEGLTAREAAEILGRPIGTVLYEVHQAVRSLREALQGKADDRQPSSRLCEASHEM
jgi:RNA polymerase sigma-70 factor (ECF subfamily)